MAPIDPESIETQETHEITMGKTFFSQTKTERQNYNGCSSVRIETL